ncbi:DUF1361 domain-containing protein [Aestuariibaculum lutulentum]|uniref:DUF1361 domain-containing protein n=1 Tax=Aestuariibaculum lutulentum TaxID=2920935 RepID=A0ABS9REJ3_9FLAO|nr:DUF1361 domain-containing protein [Aestuariibaculum lutulentum]MCH4551365.1 DUF1361 domain-containing protein [Aestuariibaculum lutulentum]
MNNLKTYIYNQFNILVLISLSVLFSIVLLMIRIKLNQSFFYLFLIWNLFLACIPFTLTSYLSTRPKQHKVSFALYFFTWLAFLPNAPYIITDFLHLRFGDYHLLWLDVLMLASFSGNGVLLFLLSVKEMKHILLQHFSANMSNYIITSVFPLTAFGVYLGRFLRYNSWEIILNPIELFLDIFNITTNPNVHFQAWIFTFVFSIFLGLLYWINNTLNKN